MEWIENLLPLILLALYFLSQIGKRRNQPERTTTPDEPLPTADAAPDAPTRRTPFEELMRQIQQAAEEAQAAQTPPAPKPPPAPPPKPAPRPLQQNRPAQRPPAPMVESEFRPVGGFEHERHGFGPDNPFSEEAFTRLPRGADVTTHAPGHLRYDPHGLFPPLGQAAPKRRHPLAERLRSPEGMREAFAFREILDAPRSRKRR